MAEDAETFAPGWPGLPARWTSSAKSGVGTSVSRDSRVWFTLSHGILNEIYYPRVDNACIRDLGFIVTDGRTYFSEEKREACSETSQVEPGIPAYRVRNTAADGRYRIEKEILTDPWRDVVLQRIRFVPLQGSAGRFPFVRAARASPRQPRAAGIRRWVGDYKGTPMLLAEREHYALALASAAPWLARSVGFVGVSDGWQELRAHKRLAAGPIRAPRTGTWRLPVRSIWGRQMERSCLRSGSVPPQWKRASTRSSACSRISTKRKRSTSEPGAPGTRDSKAAWPAEGTNPAVSDQRRGVAHARIQTRRRRNHRQPVDPLGLFQA